MTNISTSARDRDLALAIQHHMEGKYDKAEQLYLKLHHENKRDEEVLYLIGVLCCDLGIFAQAIRFLDEALSIAPNFPEAIQQLVVALNGSAMQNIDAGKLDEAEANLDRTVQLNAGNRERMRQLGRIAMLRGDFALAETRLGQVLEVLEVLEQSANDVEVLNWHGLACLQQKKYALADQSLKQALTLKPELVQAHNNLGLSLHAQGKVQEAQACFIAALQHDPAYNHARINLANTLRILGKPEEARTQLVLLLSDNPDSVEILNNLGTVLQDLGEARQARECLMQALTLAPTSPQVRWNLALSQLLLGDYANGWKNFEARWEVCANLLGAYDKPLNRAWNGEAVQGKRILLWAEQGFGDTLQFIRFADNLAQQGAIVIVEVQPELAELIASAKGVSEVISRGQATPPYDRHCPLMSLPYRLGIALTDTIGTSPYLFADPVRASKWRAQLASLASYPRHRIGLTWAGKSRLQNAELEAIDKRRSIKLQQLAPLVENQECVFFSLQKGEPADELADSGLPIHDYSAEWASFADTAAFIVNLDLVITVDTAVAHLAAALGKPVWLLNRRDSCWRWLQERDDSPWYPGLRQFRQPHEGEWNSVVSAVVQELDSFGSAFASSASRAVADVAV